MTWQKKWEDTAGQFPEQLGVKADTIYITTNNRTIIGDLALDFTDEGWNIYHVPTGACFDKGVPPSGFDAYVDSKGAAQADDEFNYDKDQLLNWMKKVQENYPYLMADVTPVDA